MALDPVTNTVGTTNLQAAGVTQQQFLQLMMIQLTQQDPLKPMDNTQFLAQLAQFSQLEVSQQMSNTETNVLAAQQASQALSLLNRTITIATNSGSSTSGQVTAIDFSSTAPLLTVTPTSGQPLTGVSLSQITGAQ